MHPLPGPFGDGAEADLLVPHTAPMARLLLLDLLHIRAGNRTDLAILDTIRWFSHERPSNRESRYRDRV